jgi:hypothetical protein
LLRQRPSNRNPELIVDRPGLDLLYLEIVGLRENVLQLIGREAERQRIFALVLNFEDDAAQNVIVPSTIFADAVERQAQRRVGGLGEAGDDAAFDFVPANALDGLESAFAADELAARSDDQLLNVAEPLKRLDELRDYQSGVLFSDRRFTNRRESALLRR